MQLTGYKLHLIPDRLAREQIFRYLDDTFLSDILSQLMDSMWPNGALRSTLEPRPPRERAKTKLKACVLLTTIFQGMVLFGGMEALTVIDTAGNLVGQANAASGAQRLFTGCQNPYLNTHLIYTLFDEMVNLLYPTLKS